MQASILYVLMISVSYFYQVFQPSKELEDLARHDVSHDGLSQCAISKICKMYDLNTRDVIKYKDYT